VTSLVGGLRSGRPSRRTAPAIEDRLSAATTHAARPTGPTWSKRRSSYRAVDLHPARLTIPELSLKIAADPP